MQHIILNHKPAKHKTEKGFTLIEMLVIAPAVILIIGTFVAFIGVLTGEALQIRAKAKMIYDTDTALQRFDQDVRFSFEFRDTSFTPPSPQGQDNNTAPFDTINRYFPETAYPLGAKRILRTYATDKNPLDSSRKLVYTTKKDGVTNSACGTATESENDPLQIDIIYYTKLDTSTSTSLWRRVIFNPTQTACSGSTIWQKKTCSPGYTSSTCQAEDEPLLDNLPQGNVSGYYANIPDRSNTEDAPFEPSHYADCINPCQFFYPTSTNAFDPYRRDGSGSPTQNAYNVSLTLTPVMNVSGKQITYRGEVYSRRLNEP